MNKQDWKNLNMTTAYQLLIRADKPEVKKLLAGSNGTKRIAQYRANYGNHLTFSYGAKHVDDTILELLQ